MHDELGIEMPQDCDPREWVLCMLRRFDRAHAKAGYMLTELPWRPETEMRAIGDAQAAAYRGKCAFLELLYRLDDPPAIAVVLEGGIVQDVVADRPVHLHDFLVIDYDIHGMEPSDISLVAQEDGSQAEAYVYSVGALGRATIDLRNIVGLLPDEEDGDDVVAE